jgi:ankyrin repeat protein
MKNVSLVLPGFTFWILVSFLASSCSLIKTSSLETAVQYKNTKEVQRHLSEGANANQKDNNGQNLLHHAAQSGHTEIAQALIDRGAIIDTKDNEGRTPLHLAAENGHAPMIDLLVNQGAQVHSQDKNDRTALHYTVLGSKKDVFFGTKSEAALMLISKGAVVDARDKKNWTPLYLASVNDLSRMVGLLVNKGAHINPKKGPSPLVGAVLEGHTQVVRVLLDKKFLVHGPDGAATTPLHLAAQKGYPDIVRLLLEKKATPNRKDGKGKTPLYYAIYNDHFHVIQELADKGVNVNQDIPEGTLLHLAAERGHVGAASALIRKGAKLELKNTKGKRPLDVAINNGNRKVADLLVQETINKRRARK